MPKGCAQATPPRRCDTRVPLKEIHANLRKVAASLGVKTLTTQQYRDSPLRRWGVSTLYLYTGSTWPRLMRGAGLVPTHFRSLADPRFDLPMPSSPPPYIPPEACGKCGHGLVFEAQVRDVQGTCQVVHCLICGWYTGPYWGTVPIEDGDLDTGIYTQSVPVLVR